MLNRTRMRKAVGLALAASFAAVALAACSSGGSGGGKVTITYLVGSDVFTLKPAQKLVAAFEKANPNITVKINQRPGGADGDNLVKTRLSTGDMDDVFQYNSGSQLQGTRPANTLVDLKGEAWTKDLTEDFKASVTADDGQVFGQPFGTTFSGGVMYNTKVYKELGLSVPKTWDEFISNSEKIKASGKTAVLQTFGDTWTSQLFVLADFANVSKQDENWAKDYTANKSSAKYAKEPGVLGFEHTSEVFKKGLVNEDFASLTNANGLKALADGSAVQYPMITAVLSTVQQSSPDKINDIGYFALPSDSGTPQMTVWEPNALYIPKSTTGDKLAAAKKLVAFVSSSAGCKIQVEAALPTGPFASNACKLPADVPTLVKDEQKYQDSGDTGLALEFLSPIKGPNLEKILIAVANGQNTPQQGAALYDQDVTKQAQQLGIKGW